MQLERLCQRQRWACGVVVIVRRHVFEATCANGCLFGHVPLRFWEWYMCHKKKTICTRLITWLTRLTKNVCVFLGWRNYSSYPLIVRAMVVPLHGVQIRSSQCIHECSSVGLQPQNHDTHDCWYDFSHSKSGAHNVPLGNTLSCGDVQC